MAYNIYTTLNPTEDVTTLRGTEVTTGMWSGDTGSLATIYTSSAQFINSGEFYYDLYNLDPATEDSAEVQFSVAYGHVYGSGSPSLTNLQNSTLPTQVTYVQYRNILLGKDTEKFTFDEEESNDIYVINMQRSRLRQAMDPGNWQLGLKGTNGGIHTFIDDSGLASAVQGNLLASNVYNIRSGTIDDGFATGNSTVYGLVFPDYGVIVLSPGRIKGAIGMTGDYNTLDLRTSTANPFSPYTGSAGTYTNYQYQHEGLVRAISASMVAAGGTGDFKARSAENITSTNYFIRLRNSQYNFSNNPTYYTGSNPQNILEPFRVKPISYATTIGLYNDSNELLAVAKLSRPIQKSTDKEALIRVRLDY